MSADADRGPDDLFIICGGGRTGQTVIHELQQTGRNFVVIEKNPEICADLRMKIPEDVLLEGDATDEETLSAAGIERAKALIATLLEDKMNLVLTVTALQMNPSLQVISRVTDDDQEERLRRAGAKVVSPAAIGGRRLGASMLHPDATVFITEMISAPSERPIRFEAVVVTEESEGHGKTLGELDLFHRTGLQVIAVGLPDGSFVFNPGHEHRLAANDRLVVIGDWHAVDELATIVGRWE
ncbi:MAG: potassium channel family protein [Planctomycetota bacterium]|jgi:voltage-gated potassium channel